MFAIRHLLSALPWQAAAAGVLLAAVTSPAMAEGSPLLADNPANQAWHAPQRQQQLIYVGDAQDTPTLVLEKAPFLRGRVVLDILSDTQVCVLRSGPEEVSLTLAPNRPNRLVLQGTPEDPAITLNGERLAAPLGRWVRLCLAPQGQITLTFQHATFCNVQLEADEAVHPREALQALDEPVPPAAEAVERMPAEAHPLINAVLPSDGSGTPADLGGSDGVGLIIPRGTGYPSAADESGSAMPMGPRPLPAAVPRRGAEPAAVAAAALGSARATGTPQLVNRPPASDEHLLREGTMEWDLHLSFGAGIQSASFFRGIAQENQDRIIQIYSMGRLTLYEGDRLPFLNQLNIDLTATSHHHYGPSGREDFEAWYEVDWWGGMSARMFDRFTFGVYPHQRAFISERRSDVHMVDLTLDYDDHDPRYSFQLSPHAVLSFEYEHQSDGGQNFRVQESPTFGLGTYLGLGIRPQFELFRLNGRVPVSLAVPMTLGLSLSDYFENLEGEDDAFGFFDVGLEVGVPVMSVPVGADRSLNFTLITGLHVLFLGDTLQDLSRANGVGGDDVEFIGSAYMNIDY